MLFVGQDHLRTVAWTARLEQQAASFQSGRSRLKEMLDVIIRREETTLQFLIKHEVDELDQMQARRDPVRARDAFDVMICLAFTGEFEQMAAFLRWLAGEWGRDGVQTSLDSDVQMPPMANMVYVLCAFRLFAEPMLAEEVVKDVQGLVGKVGRGWTWPTDKEVKLFRDNYPSESFHKLSHALEWARYWKTVGATEERERVGVKPPRTWKRVLEDVEAEQTALSENRPVRTRRHPD
jgi:hypothetical protein